MHFERASGILLHPTSLPGSYGIGDLGPTGFGDSPYQTFSSFAGNPLLVSPEALAVYQDKRRWRGLQRDFSWERSAEEYLGVYKALLRERVRELTH